MCNVHICWRTFKFVVSKQSTEAFDKAFEIFQIYSNEPFNSSAALDMHALNIVAMQMDYGIHMKAIAFKPLQEK